MRTFTFLVLLFVGLQASAQKHLRFQTSVQAGLLEGERGGAFQLQTINGFQFKTWAAGLGAGLDYYHTRSLPVYLNLRKSLNSAAQAPFFYLSAGYHIPWLREEDKFMGQTAAKGGLYYDAGIGYQLPVRNNAALFFTAGFSQKEFSLRETDGAVIAIFPMPPPQTRLHEYTLRRLSLQTGLRF